MREEKQFVEPEEIAVIAPSGDVVQAAQSIIVSDSNGEVMAASFLGKVKSVLKKIEAKRKEYVAPLNDVVGTINSDAKKSAAPFVQAESIIKKALSDYAVELDKKRRDEEAARSAEQRKLLEQAVVAAPAKQEEILEKIGDIESAPLPAVTKGAYSDSGMVSYRKVWKWRVKSENDIPRQYLTVHDASITAAVRCGVRDITGIEIYEEKTVVTR
jgi:hypothetical protein